MTPRKWAAFAALACVTVSLFGFVAIRSAASSTVAAAPFVVPSLSDASATKLTAAEATNQKVLVSALNASTWPTSFSPSLDSLPAAFVPEWIKDNCLTVTQQNVSQCVYGDKSASKTAVVLGDSHAVSYLPAIRAALKSGWRIQVLTMQQCPAADVPVTKGGTAGNAPFAECAAHRAWTWSWLQQNHPDLAIWTDATHMVDRMTESSDTAKMAALQSGTEKTVQAIASDVKTVLVVGGPPDMGSLTACKTALATPHDCVKQVPSAYVPFVNAQQAGVSAAGAKNVTYVPTESWYCIQSSCPAFVGSIAQTVDGTHLTQPASKRLAPLFVEAIASAEGTKTP